MSCFQEFMSILPKNKDFLNFLLNKELICKDSNADILNFYLAN